MRGLFFIQELDIESDILANYSDYDVYDRICTEKKKALKSKLFLLNYYSFISFFFTFLCKLSH